MQNPRIPSKSTIRIPTMQSNSRIVLIIATFKMNANEIVSVLKGKTDKVKTQLSSDPRKSVTAGFVGLGFAGLGYSVISDNHNSIDNSLASFIRALSFNSNEIISHSLNNFQTVYDSVKDSGASLSMISEDGLSGLKTGLGLACAGVVKAVGPPADINTNKEPSYVDIEDDMGSDEITHKSGNGKGLAVLGFLGLATVGAGVYAYYSLAGDTPVVDQKVSDSNPSYPQTDAPPVTDTEPVVEPVTVSNHETPVETPIAEPAIEPVNEPVEIPWYAHMENAEVDTYSTMFGEDVYAVKGSVLTEDYTLYDIEKNMMVLTHQEWNPSQLRLDLDLSSDQYRALNDQYGTMISATMETIDLDQDGTMDRVAIHYEGTGGDEGKVLDFEMDYIKNQDVVSYLYLHLTGR